MSGSPSFSTVLLPSLGLYLGINFCNDYISNLGLWPIRYICLTIPHSISPPHSISWQPSNTASDHATLDSTFCSHLVQPTLIAFRRPLTMRLPNRSSSPHSSHLWKNSNTGCAGEAFCRVLHVHWSLAALSDTDAGPIYPKNERSFFLTKRITLLW